MMAIWSTIALIDPCLPFPLNYQFLRYVALGHIIFFAQSVLSIVYGIGGGLLAYTILGSLHHLSVVRHYVVHLQISHLQNQNSPL